LSYLFEKNEPSNRRISLREDEKELRSVKSAITWGATQFRQTGVVVVFVKQEPFGVRVGGASVQIMFRSCFRFRLVIERIVVVVVDVVVVVE
jgi:hypothetical protein